MTNLDIEHDHNRYEVDELVELHSKVKVQAAKDAKVEVPSGPGGLPAWRENYPYDTKLTRRSYERQKRQLQVELLKLQLWIRTNNEKVAILFEGRDAAGKGGSIKRFMEHLNPRGARIVALSVPTEREQSQWYFQRYVEHLPSGGELVFFDRSWYNRAGVERVMGYCDPAQYLEFMRTCPEFERMLVDSGIHLIKFWFSVSQAEQAARFLARSNDPVKQWTVSYTHLTLPTNREV